MSALGTAFSLIELLAKAIATRLTEAGKRRHAKSIRRVLVDKDGNETEVKPWKGGK